MKNGATFVFTAPSEIVVVVEIFACEVSSVYYKKIIFLPINKFLLNQGFDHCIHVFVLILRRSFTRDYLKNYNDSEHAIKTKNVPNFMNFSNIYKLWQLFPE